MAKKKQPWKPTYYTREEALHEFVRYCIKGVTSYGSKVDDPEGCDICNPSSLQQFVNDALVRAISKVANSLNLDQATLEHDIRAERALLLKKRREESSS